MIDDFRVPEDDGYGFDTYGNGLELNESLLPPLPKWGLFYPRLPSAEESGARRGCCVLASPDLVSSIEAVDELRKYN